MIYIIFDLEATCDERENQDFKNETIEIGAIKFNNDFKEDMFQSFIRPVFTPITKYCTNLTGIKEDDVKFANTFPYILKQFKEWSFGDNVKENVIFCSWGFYDKKQIILDSERHNLSFEEYGFIANNHISIKHEFPNVYKKEKIKKRGIGIIEALTKSDLNFKGINHRALDDAYNIGRIFIEYYDDWGFVK